MCVYARGWACLIVFVLFVRNRETKRNKAKKKKKKDCFPLPQILLLSTYRRAWHCLQKLGLRCPLHPFHQRGGAHHFPDQVPHRCCRCCSAQPHRRHRHHRHSGCCWHVVGVSACLLWAGGFRLCCCSHCCCRRFCCWAALGAHCLPLLLLPSLGQGRPCLLASSFEAPLEPTETWPLLQWTTRFLPARPFLSHSFFVFPSRYARKTVHKDKGKKKRQRGQRPMSSQHRKAKQRGKWVMGAKPKQQTIKQTLLLSLSFFGCNDDFLLIQQKTLTTTTKGFLRTNSTASDTFCSFPCSLFPTSTSTRRWRL